MTAWNRVSVWRRFETLLFQSDWLQNIGSIHIEKTFRDGQRDEDKLGVPGGHPNTHLHRLTGGLCWYRSVLLQGLGAEPMLAVKIFPSCGAALAFSPDERSFNLLLSDVRSFPCLFTNMQHECLYRSYLSFTHTTSDTPWHPLNPQM